MDGGLKKKIIIVINTSTEFDCSLPLNARVFDYLTVNLLFSESEYKTSNGKIN